MRSLYFVLLIALAHSQGSSDDFSSLDDTDVIERPCVAPACTVFASGFNNLRGLHVNKGILYGAEAGYGPLVFPTITEGQPLPESCVQSPEGVKCLGQSGAIVAIYQDGTFARIVENLPSLASSDGSFAIGGPTDVLIDGKNVYGLLGAGLPVEAYQKLQSIGGNLLGTFGQISNRRYSVVANISEYEFLRNPDGAEVNSNPFSLAGQGNRFYVSDAGANAVFQVDLRPRVSVRVYAVLPRISPQGEGVVQNKVRESNDQDNSANNSTVDTTNTVEAVPTGVAINRGSVYVGQLSGVDPTTFTFYKGIANVDRFDSNGRRRVEATGFTTIVDIDFTRDGDLLVLENGAANQGRGALYRVDRHTKRVTTLLTGLLFPTGLAVDRNVVYVNDQSTFANKPGSSGLSSRVLKVQL